MKTTATARIKDGNEYQYAKIKADAIRKRLAGKSRFPLSDNARRVITSQLAELDLAVTEYEIIVGTRRT